MSFSSTVPPSREALFNQVHQDIHDNNKAKLSCHPRPR